MKELLMQVGTPVPEAERSAKEAAGAETRRNIDHCNDLHKNLITTASIFIGSNALVADKEFVYGWTKIAEVILLSFVIIISAVALLPKIQSIDHANLNLIEEFRKKAFRRKLRMLYVAYSALIAAIMMFMVVVVVKGQA